MKKHQGSFGVTKKTPKSEGLTDVFLFWAHGGSGFVWVPTRWCWFLSRVTYFSNLGPLNEVQMILFFPNKFYSTTKPFQHWNKHGRCKPSACENNKHLVEGMFHRLPWLLDELGLKNCTYSSQQMAICPKNHSNSYEICLFEFHSARKRSTFRGYLALFHESRLLHEVKNRDGNLSQVSRSYGSNGVSPWRNEPAS